MTRAMLTAEGTCDFDDDGKNGALFFLTSHRGPDAAMEMAAETARIFMGIQIQCAQCHDHPSDQWKRVQFHELAGYFARTRERLKPAAAGKRASVELVSAPRGEHEMPSPTDAKKTLLTPPRFLDGKAAGQNLSDADRRTALANAITDKSNYWFAGAYINRIWGELMGQAFYQPVDDMGPKKEAVFPGVLTRLTGAFCGSKLPDAQAAYESANSLNMALLAGVNFMLHACGWLEGGLVSSYENGWISDDNLEKSQSHRTDLVSSYVKNFSMPISLADASQSHRTDLVIPTLGLPAP